MTAWRIVSERRREVAFNGEGARLHGGRFNSRGTPMAYASTALSLAVLEQLVHVDRMPALRRYVAIPVSFDDALLRSIDRRDLPGEWNRPTIHPQTQWLGDAWVDSQASVALAVPSVLLPEMLDAAEHNVLLNPQHPDFSSIRIGDGIPLRFDERFGSS